MFLQYCILHLSAQFLLILAQRLLERRLNHTDQSIRFLQEQMKRERLLLISNKESLEDLERNAHVGEGLSQWQVSLKDCKVLIGLYSKH